MDKATNDNGRDLTADESSTFEAGQAEVRSLDQQIQRAEFLAEDERRAPGQPLRDDADPEIRAQSIRETILYKMDPSALSQAQRIKVEGDGLVEGDEIPESVRTSALLHVSRLYDDRQSENPPVASATLANRYRNWDV